MQRAARYALAVWAVVVALGVVWGRLAPLSDEASINAAPFYGTWEWHGSWWLLIAAALAAAIVAADSTERLRLWMTAPLAGAWTVTLAASDGWDRVIKPMRSERDTLAVLRRIDSPADFVRTFLDRIDVYPTHVRGHPPGAPLIFWWLDRLGLGGERWATVIVIACWAMGAALVVWIVCELGDSITLARGAVAGVALIPAAIWAGTSTDAFYAGAAALTVALTVRAVRPGRRGAGVSWGLAAGLAWGGLAFLSYGLATLAVVAIALCAVRRRPDVLAAIGVGGLAVVAMFGAYGFWWWDGLAETRQQYLIGLARIRPFPYFAIAGNPGAFALAIGPLIAAGVGLSLAGRHLSATYRTFVASTLAAVLVANLSGMSKGEVERIWLPFALLLAGSAAAVPPSRWRTCLLSGAAVSAVLVQGWLRTPW